MTTRFNKIKKTMCAALSLVMILPFGTGMFDTASALNEPKETQLYETLDAISWSFRGFINKNNDQLVKPTDPVRYLCPYSAKVITDHRGLIRNYYGY